MADITVTLTKRQLTLIRVACLQRLDRLTNVPNEIAEDVHESYLETRAMLDSPDGVLYKAMLEVHCRHYRDGKAAP